MELTTEGDDEHHLTAIFLKDANTDPDPPLMVNHDESQNLLNADLLMQNIYQSEEFFDMANQLGVNLTNVAGGHL